MTTLRNSKPKNELEQCRITFGVSPAGGRIPGGGALKTSQEVDCRKALDKPKVSGATKTSAKPMRVVRNAQRQRSIACARRRIQKPAIAPLRPTAEAIGVSASRS